VKNFVLRHAVNETLHIAHLSLLGRYYIRKRGKMSLRNVEKFEDFIRHFSCVRVYECTLSPISNHAPTALQQPDK